MTVRLTGRAAAPGAALAPAFVIRSRATATSVARPTGTPEEEQARLASALKEAETQLRTLAEEVAVGVGEDEAEIFEAHAEFAADPELVARANERIAAGTSAEDAVTAAFGAFRELLEGAASEYLAARAADLDDVRDRVVAILRGEAADIEPPAERSVIVAHELTPSQTASLPRELIAAVVTATGSPTSHAAILARSIGIPGVVGVGGLLEAVADGAEVAVDGRTGDVLVSPDGDERTGFLERLEREQRRREELEVLRSQPGATADGHHVEVAANIGSRDDVKAALEAGAEGSGLVRTEFMFLDRSTAPTVDEQAGFYREVLAAFPGHRVVFRTLDVGADKPLPFVVRDPEPNPALGVRGIRLSLQRDPLFRDQLRALLRAEDEAGPDAGRLAIMFPLVSSAAELAAARRAVETVAAEEGHDLGGVEIGAMVEVPSAALSAARLAAHADFLSIGTNDLLQYLFAADRLVTDVADLADVLDPDVLRLIASVIEAGHAGGAWVGVCGEAASDSAFAVVLTGLGVDELSMTRVAIPEVKDQLRRLTLDECRHAAEVALAATDAADARNRLRELL
ncbi:MAG: phosphoenolpyruvate--protein phosphotransferase [Nitriliruptorales bacterium]